ncbi:MAG: ABC transporter ATP-binding protein [Rhodospirillales bacterium]|nr:ABC transporter ATP-binding protein [Rhodospirillales bacterium]
MTGPQIESKTDPRSGTVEVDHLFKYFGTEKAVNDVSLSVAQGEFVTLLGPSGCGKTTTLRCVAGLERLNAGEIRIGGEIVASIERDIYLTPEDRNIGMVFQSYAVWPHMTVFDNVAYGLRVRQAPAAEIKRKTDRVLELVGLDQLADRFATKLSGGQRQRVALARAIVYEPKVVLFDEPLSNLDAKLREQMRIEIVRLQREVGITSIFVTHDQSEALVMSDRIVVMDKGVIQQIGDPKTIYAHPANVFVAKFIGVANLMEGVLLGRSGALCDVEISLGEGLAPLRIQSLGGEGAVAGQTLHLCLRPEDILVNLQRPDGQSQGNTFEGKVIDTVYLGNFLECRVQVGRYEVCIQIDHYEQLVAGQSVFLSFRPEHGLCLTE